MACGANLADTSAERLTGATVLFWTSSPSQSWAPTMTSGPLPTLVASLNCWRTSVATWTTTLMPFSLPNASAYFWMTGARSLSAQITRSALSSRTGAAVVDTALAALTDGLTVEVEDPPQALMSSAATPITAAAPIARSCMIFLLGNHWAAPRQPLV